MAFRSAASAAAADKTPVVSRPTGVTTDDILIAFYTCDGTAGTIDWTTAGFTAFTQNDQASPDGQTHGAAWRRAGGSEAATYTFSSDSSGISACACILAFSGRSTSSPPVATLTTPNTSANATPISMALTGVTASANDDIACGGSVDVTTTVTATFAPPTNYTEAADLYESGNLWSNLTAAYRDAVSAGATGTLTFTATLGSGAGGFAGYVIRIPVAGGDTTAPTLTSAVGTTTGSTTATIGATTDEANGTMYGVVTGSVTQPSVAQIKAGQDHTGAAAAYGSSQAISSTGAKTFSATGLTASTTYYGHIVHTDAAANDSNRISSASFTTDAAGGSKLLLQLMNS